MPVQRANRMSHLFGAKFVGAPTGPASDFDHLIPAWITRLREQLETSRRHQQRISDALAAGQDMPAIDLGYILAVGGNLEAGATVKAGYLSRDDDANRALYNTRYTLPELLYSDWVAPIPEVQPLMDYVSKLAP